MNPRDTHVLPAMQGGWDVFRSRSVRSSRIFKTKKEAVAYARALAKKDKVTLIVHRYDATVQEMTSYSKVKQASPTQ
jgi:hypothetical protein